MGKPQWYVSTSTRPTFLALKTYTDVVLGVVSSNIFLDEESPRFWTGHGTILAYQIVCLLGGTIFVWVMLRIENSKRKSGKRDNMLAGKTEEEIWVAGDNRPDFIYTM